MWISDILQIYLVHSTYDGFLWTRAMKEGNIVKPTVIPSKSHSVAVFITWYCMIALFIASVIQFFSCNFSYR